MALDRHAYSILISQDFIVAHAEAGDAAIMLTCCRYIILYSFNLSILYIYKSLHSY